MSWPVDLPLDGCWKTWKGESGAKVITEYEYVGGASGVGFESEIKGGMPLPFLDSLNDSEGW